MGDIRQDFRWGEALRTATHPENLIAFHQRVLRVSALSTTLMGVFIGPSRVWALEGRPDYAALTIIAGWLLFTAASVTTLALMARSYVYSIRLYLGSIVVVIAIFVVFESPMIAVICLLLGLPFVQQAAIALDTLRSHVGWVILTSGLLPPLLLVRMWRAPIEMFADPIELAIGIGGPSMALLCLGAIATLTRRALADASHSAARHASHLEHLNVELERARDDAMAASRAKSAFLTTMSHELRTPLNAIMGYASMIAEDSPPDTDIPDDAEKIHHAATHLLGLIEQVLDLAQIEAGGVVTADQPADVALAAKEAYASVQPQILASGGHLHIEDNLGGVVSYHSPARLKQVMVILLTNGAQFGEGAKMVLRLSTQAGSPVPMLVIEVQDEGPGIPQDQLHRIFEPFTQVDETPTRRHDGAGMGLALAKGICSQLGGSLRAHSTLGVGSTFTARLPLPRADHDRFHHPGVG